MRQEARLLRVSWFGGVRLAGLVACILCARIAAAQTKAHLVFPSAGTREVWVASSLPETPPSATIKADGAAIDVPLAGAAAKDSVLVWDRKTGNVASKPIAKIQGEWKLAVPEFRTVGLVRIRVEHKGLPVAAASVTLKTGKRVLTQVLDPTAKGVVDFFGIAPGQFSVSTQYRSGGKTQAPQTQIFEVALAHQKPDLEFVTSISDEVETIGAPASAPSGKAGTRAEPAERSSPLGQALVALIVLVAAVAAIYGAMLYLKRNPEKVQKQLEKLGVQVPEPPDAASATHPPTPPAPPAPPEKIILGDAPTDAATTGGIVNPRLVRDNGQTLAIPEGASVVGREDGLAMALVGESSVSRHHAEITRAGSQVTVKDLGSTNGTFVNGVKLMGEQTLGPGDSVQFGAVRFRFEG